MLTIQQTMVDAGAIPMAWGIAVCLGNGPTDLPTDHAAEVCEAGPSGVSQIPRWVKRWPYRDARTKAKAKDAQSCPPGLSGNGYPKRWTLSIPSMH